MNTGIKADPAGLTVTGNSGALPAHGVGEWAKKSVNIQDGWTSDHLWGPHFRSLTGLRPSVGVHPAHLQ